MVVKVKKHMAKNGIQNKVDIAVLKTEVTGLKTNVDLIMNNHLPHIHEKLDEIDKKIAYYMGGMAVLAVILSIFLKFWPK